jgi:Polyketide cyclase / dehydrase and lipid transport
MSLVVARRGLVLAALSLAAVASSATFAHGPTRQKVTETIEINAPAEKVWAVVGNFYDLGWLPAVAKTEGTGDLIPDKSMRHVTLKNGGEINESLDKYDARKFTIAYRIEKVDVKILPVTNYSSTLTVTPDGNKSTVEWRGAFYRGYPLNDPPPELSDAAAVKAVTELYKSGLAALKARIEAGT